MLAGSALLGVLMGFLWHWLAPKVPLYADSSAVYLKDPEGEQAIGADGTFAILGAGAGLVVGAVAYWLSRRRQGGITVALGLAAGGLLGAFVAMWLGTALGPGGNVIATAKSVPAGQTFYGPLKLTAKGVLLTWPAFAMIALLALTALFTPKPQAPPVVWQTPAQDGPDTP
nr:ABC transporter permease [Streptacidiphilus carbonis]